MIQGILLIAGSAMLNYAFLRSNPWLAISAGFTYAAALHFFKEIS